MHSGCSDLPRPTPESPVIFHYSIINVSIESWMVSVDFCCLFLPLHIFFPSPPCPTFNQREIVIKDGAYECRTGQTVFSYIFSYFPC